QLVSTSGNRVLGYGVNDQFVIDTNTVKPLSIPFGGSAVAQETNNVTLVGNLLPNDANLSTTPGVIESVILNAKSVEKPLTAPDIHQLHPPTMGTASANASGSGGGPTGIEAGTYTYKIVFVDPNAPAGHNETSPSLASATVTTDGTNSVNL